jgi:hypothetical protein
MMTMIQGAVPVPRRCRRLQERVLARDLEYFARHPDARSYDRPFVPGETWPLAATDLADVTSVRVMRVTLDGRPYRARLFFDATGTAREVPRC